MFATFVRGILPATAMEGFSISSSAISSFVAGSREPGDTEDAVCAASDSR